MIDVESKLICIADDIIDKAHTMSVEEISKCFDNLPEKTKKRLRSMSHKYNYFVRITFDEKELEVLGFGKERVREQNTEKSTENNN